VNIAEVVLREVWDSLSKHYPSYKHSFTIFVGGCNLFIIADSGNICVVRIVDSGLPKLRIRAIKPGAGPPVWEFIHVDFHDPSFNVNSVVELVLGHFKKSDFNG